MNKVKETTVAQVIFVNCKDDFERIKIIQNLYGVNNTDANMILARWREEGNFNG